MKVLKKYAAAALCAALIFTFAACNGDQNNNSSTTADSSTGSTVSQEAETGSSNVEGETSSSNSAVDSSSDVAASEDTSTDGDIISQPEDYTYVPEISVGDADFQSAFKANPIDEKYNADLSVATSAPKIVEVNTTAADSWIKMIDLAYQQALETAADDAAKAEITKGQEEWEAAKEQSLADIESEYEGDEVAMELVVPEQKMRFYRERAATLLEICYRNSGEMPAFDGAMGAAG